MRPGRSIIAVEDLGDVEVGEVGDDLDPWLVVGKIVLETAAEA